MANPESIPAALALDGLAGAGSALDARQEFSLAADAGYRGIAFATNHKELNPTALGPSARRHVRAMLAGKSLAIESLRVAMPRGITGGGLAESGTIDRTLDNARQAMLLARELGVSTVSLNIGNLQSPSSATSPSPAPRGEIPEATIISALRELAQQADAAGLTLALTSSGSTDALARILKAVDFDRAKLNLDGARLIEAGEDPLKVAEAFQGGIGQFTAADAVRSGRQVRATMLGEGQLPFPELLEILQENGFRGPMVVDVRNLSDGIAGARHAAEVLQKLLRRR